MQTLKLKLRSSLACHLLFFLSIALVTSSPITIRSMRHQVLRMETNVAA